MPRTDLKGLREFVANVLDYDPNNDTYRRQIDRLLNEHDRQICTAKPYTFINKVSDVFAYKDVAAGSLSITQGDKQLDSGTSLFEEWMVNQEVVINGYTYVIAIVDSATRVYLQTEFAQATVSGVEGTIINRYLDMPADCTSVSSIARRSGNASEDPGMLPPLTRFEDEWENLPMDETGLPTVYIPYDAAYIAGPRKAFSLTTAATSGAGTRTIEIAATFIRGGRESTHGEIEKITLTDTQNLVLSPFTNPLETGLRKRYYFRCPELGYQEFRLLDDPANPGEVMDLAPNDSASRTFTTLTQGNLESAEAFYRQERMQGAEGFIQRVRLYPRQGSDYTFTVRYLQNHRPMVEDGDASSIPPELRMVVAYSALADIFMKHDNPVQSELYARRAEGMLLQMDRRYLTQKSARIVKGGWMDGTRGRVVRRATLVHS